MTNHGPLHIFLCQILQQYLARGITFHATVTHFVCLTWLLFIYHLYLSRCLNSSHRFCVFIFLLSTGSTSLSLSLSVPLSRSFLHSSVSIISPPGFFFFVVRFILQSRGLMLCFSLINVCLANTLIISTRANRIDNYTLYTEALSLILFVFSSFPPTASSVQFLLSFSVFLQPIVCGVLYFWEQCGVFPLVIDINEVLLDWVRSCEWCLSVSLDQKYNRVATE